MHAAMKDDGVLTNIDSVSISMRDRVEKTPEGHKTSLQGAI